MLRKTAAGLACLVGASLLVLLGTGVSIAADRTVKMTFSNGTDGDTELFWLDSGKGKEVSYGVVPKGKSTSLQTHHGHVWIVRGANGDELERYTVDSPDGADVAFGLRGPQANLLRKDTSGQDTKDKSGQDTVATAKEVLDYVNQERRKDGKPALVVDPELTRAAQGYARFLAQKHNGLVKQGYTDADARDVVLPRLDLFRGHKQDGREPWDRAQAAGFPHNIKVGEVIHAGPNINAEQAVRLPGYGWMYSTGHRKEILSVDYNYTLAGSAVAYTDTGVPYYVLMLAEPRQ
jgi:uncharacterized protein YkwD